MSERGMGVSPPLVEVSLTVGGIEPAIGGYALPPWRGGEVCGEVEDGKCWETGGQQCFALWGY